jgi:hypothetical protein
MVLLKSNMIFTFLDAHLNFTQTLLMHFLGIWAFLLFKVELKHIEEKFWREKFQS